MNIYENCLSVVSDKSDSVLSPQYSDYSALEQLKPEQDQSKSLDSLRIYYVSDIHLEHRIINAFPNGASDQMIEEYISRLIAGMLTDDLVLRGDTNTLVFFGGDTASDFKLSTFFYTKFIETWDALSKDEYDKTRERILPLLREQSKIHEEISQWKDKHRWVKDAKKDLLEYSSIRVPERIKNIIRRESEINDVIVAETSGNRYYYDSSWSRPIKSIFAVLGNHELWAFDSYEKCVDAYQSFFASIGIEFLNNTDCYITRERITAKGIDNPEERLFFRSCIHNVRIVGGVGFSGCNETMNAEQGIYRNTVNRQQEIQYSKEWEQKYYDALKKCKKTNTLLIVLTHNPLFDWSRQKHFDCNCIYFCGHNHRNTLRIQEDTNTFVYADNQIGYHSEHVGFKKADVYKRCNPFAMYDDGYHVVDSYNYNAFNRFSGIYIDGLKILNKYINNGAQLYLIKEKGYYGFFVVLKEKAPQMNPGTFICIGGKIKRVGYETEIESYYNKFSMMISGYLKLLSPYRCAQEAISKEVKLLGGDGKIHGYIIDIDWSNHIMLNPHDGKVTFYHSPIFGLIKRYNTIKELLAAHNPELLNQFEKENGMIEKSRFNLLTICNNDSGEYAVVDIKNSQYVESYRMNQLQRLFDAKVLRDWDEEILNIPKNLSIRETSETAE